MSLKKFSFELPDGEKINIKAFNLKEAINSLSLIYKENSFIKFAEKSKIEEWCTGFSILYN